MSSCKCHGKCKRFSTKRQWQLQPSTILLRCKFPETIQNQHCWNRWELWPANKEDDGGMSSSLSRWKKFALQEIVIHVNQRSWWREVPRESATYRPNNDLRAELRLVLRDLLPPSVRLLLDRRERLERLDLLYLGICIWRQIFILEDSRIFATSAIKIDRQNTWRNDCLTCQTPKRISRGRGSAPFQ